MLFVVLTVIFLMVGLLGYRSYRKTFDPASHNVPPGGFVAGVSWVVAVFFFFVIVVVNGEGYTDIVNNNAHIKETRKTERVLKVRAADVGDTLKDYLTEKYPEYESTTIQKMVEGGPTLVLLKFPELKAVETFLEYARTYKSLKDDVYAQATKRNTLERENDKIQNNDLMYITALFS